MEVQSIPWIALTAHGFVDSPISWKSTEHGYHFTGDNTYTYVIFPNDDYWLYVAVGAFDQCL